MITEFVLNMLHGLATGLFGWLSANLPEAPGFWTDASDAVTQAGALIPAQLLWFVPVVPLVSAASAVLALVVGLGLLRLARRVVSVFTGGGGMA